MSAVRTLTLSLALAALLAGPAFAQDPANPAEDMANPAEDMAEPTEEPPAPTEEPPAPTEEPPAPTEEPPAPGIDEAIDDLGAEEPNPWSGSLEFGATYSSGNSDRVDISALGQAVRETPTEKLEAKFSVLYGLENRERVVNEKIASLRGDWKLHPWYAFLLLSAERDEFELIEWRFIVAPGVGRWFINDDRTQLKAEVGPAYTYEYYDQPGLPYGTGSITNLPPGERESRQQKEGKLQLRVAVFAFQKIFNDASITQEIEWYPEIGHPDSFRLISTTTFEQPLSEAWFFKAQAISQYNTPVAKDIERHDFKAIFSLVLKF